MNNLSTTSALVKDILTENPASRDSDNFLFYLVCKKLLADQGIDIEDMGFVKLFLSLPAYNLPQYETVGRCRRKMQQVFPELKCSLEVGMTRGSNADAFAEFGRDGE